MKTASIKYAFNRCLRWTQSSTRCNDAGSMFQVLGSAAANDLLPSQVLINGTTHMGVLEDHSRQLTSSTSWHSSDIDTAVLGNAVTWTLAWPVWSWYGVKQAASAVPLEQMRCDHVDLFTWSAWTPHFVTSVMDEWLSAQNCSYHSRCYLSCTDGIIGCFVVN